MALNRVVRVNLSNNNITHETIDGNRHRSYVGGVGIGARLLYEEVTPNIKWNDPQNKLVISAGPLNGTVVAGSGAFCVVTKGCLTNGATSSQASGFFGAFMRLSGFETIVVEGRAADWKYLYLHNGRLEIRDASQLEGKDTWETEDMIKRQLGAKKKDLSVYSIGPAGENLVKFACICGDRGHVAAHNGLGAVMGSKKLKALVALRGAEPLFKEEHPGLLKLNRQMLARTKSNSPMYEFGTSHLVEKHIKSGVLPIKNLTTNLFPNYERLTGKYYRARFNMKRNPCWRCPLRHCHIVEVTEGPYQGYVAEEPDYESFAGWGSLIGQSDPGAVVMLSDTADRLGLDTNEASWLIAMVMECYEKGVLSRRDTDGIDMSWGNVEAVREMLNRIGFRLGFGDILAEGVKTAAERIGGEAPNLAVYVMKGHAPRGHDHRARWLEMFDTATSDCGTIAVGPQPVDEPFNPKAVVETMTKKRIRHFVDSLVVCMFPSMTMTSPNVDLLVEMLNIVTDWDYTEKEVFRVGSRIDNVLRAFNLRHGITADVESPSKKYGSAPTDGPVEGISIMPEWEAMRGEYYRRMGWDDQTGKPLPETLKNLGLDDIIQDIWT